MKIYKTKTWQHITTGTEGNTTVFGVNMVLKELRCMSSCSIYTLSEKVRCLTLPFML